MTQIGTLLVVFIATVVVFGAIAELVSKGQVVKNDRRRENDGRSSNSYVCR